MMYDANCGQVTYNSFNDKILGPCSSCAPEVLEGKGYYHCSDVWALGMTPLRQFSEGAFAYELPGGPHYFEAVTIAQLMRIYPNWVPTPVDGKTCMDMPLQEMFAKASDLKPRLPVAPLTRQLKDIDAPRETKDLMGVLLSLYTDRRKSASVILQTKESIWLIGRQFTLR